MADKAEQELIAVADNKTGCAPSMLNTYSAALGRVETGL
jgi:hypothetical protein